MSQWSLRSQKCNSKTRERISFICKAIDRQGFDINLWTCVSEKYVDPPSKNRCRPSMVRQFIPDVALKE